MRIFNLKASDITNLDLKLEGKLPIDRDELIALVNSWGRSDWFYTIDKDGNGVLIESCKANKKYELSKLDVSEITNFDDIFRYSYFNNDIFLWNVSKATSMKYLFYEAKNFNKSLNLWNISKIESCIGMFYGTISFEKRFNNGKDLPYGTFEIKNWLKDNKNKMIAIEIEENKAKDLDNFLSNINVITSTKLNELYNVIDFANLNGLHNINGIDNGNI